MAFRQGNREPRVATTPTTVDLAILEGGPNRLLLVAHVEGFRAGLFILGDRQ